ncbi:MAG: hypothetical protein RLZZ127_2841 [Planctomycetota bacterium]|jgi:hypothetical protein
MRLLVLLIPTLSIAADVAAPAEATPTAATAPGTVVTQVGPVSITEQEHVRADGWDLGLTGIRFGGITGATALVGLSYDQGGPLVPELSAGLGVSGCKVALGCSWLLRERQRTISAAGMEWSSDDQVSITPRLAVHRRWEDEDRNPFWRGIVDHDGWYAGGEIGLAFDNLAVDIGCTVRTDDEDREPVFTLAYGLDF